MFPSMREWPRSNPFRTKKPSEMGCRVKHRIDHVEGLWKELGLDKTYKVSGKTGYSTTPLPDHPKIIKTIPKIGSITLVGKNPESIISIQVHDEKHAKPVVFYTDVTAGFFARKFAREMKGREGWLIGMHVRPVKGNEEEYLNAYGLPNVVKQMRQLQKDIESEDKKPKQKK